MTRGLIAVLVAAVGLAVAAGLAAVFFPVFRSPYEAQAWREATCEVVSADIVDGGDGDWSARVSWRYEVGGNHYQRDGDEPALFGVVHDQAEARAELRRYAVGTSVPCWYDPDDPIRSTLDRSKPPALAFIAAIVIVALAALAAIGLALRVFFSRRAPPGPAEGGTADGENSGPA